MRLRRFLPSLRRLYCSGKWHREMVPPFFLPAPIIPVQGYDRQKRVSKNNQKNEPHESHTVPDFIPNMHQISKIQNLCFVVSLPPPPPLFPLSSPPSILPLNYAAELPILAVLENTLGYSHCAMSTFSAHYY